MLPLSVAKSQEERVMARANHPAATGTAVCGCLNCQGVEQSCRQSILSIPQSRPLWVCIFAKHTQLLLLSNWKWSVARRGCRAMTGPLSLAYCSPGCTVSLVWSFPSPACIALASAVRCSRGKVFSDSCSRMTWYANALCTTLSNAKLQLSSLAKGIDSRQDCGWKGSALQKIR